MPERNLLRSKVDNFYKVLREVPELKYADDPILRTVCLSVSVVEGTQIGAKLAKALIAYRNIVGIGRGLAAPQIGTSKSVFVTYVGDEIEVFINPTIKSVSETNNYYKEVCLSITGMVYADVERPDSIEMG